MSHANTAALRAVGSEFVETRSPSSSAKPLELEPRKAVTVDSTPGRRLFRMILGVVWVTAVGALIVYGLPYYLTPIAQRPYSDLHEMLKPSGLVGQGLGVIGTAMIVTGVVLYSLRKRFAWLRVAKLKHWLDLHIFLCTLGPVLVMFHTTFKIGGIVSIAFWSMVVVVLSGVFGRHVYGHIPRTIGGQVASLRSIELQRAAVIDAIRADFDLSPRQIEQLLPAAPHRRPRGLLHALGLALQYDLRKRAQRRRICRLLKHDRDDRPTYMRDTIIDLVQAQLQLEQQIVLLQPFQRLFRYWHMLHLPLATVIALVVAIHVIVSILFGYTWVF